MASDDLIKDLRDRIAKLGKSEELIAVYSEQMEWARHFNGLIWAIGAILVPASLAGFVLTFKDDKGNIQVDILDATSVASSGLLFFWTLFAEWHRKLWIRAFELAGIIEEEWKLRSPAADQNARTRHLLYFRTRADLGFYLRWVLVFLATLAWVFKAWPFASRWATIILFLIPAMILVLAIYNYPPVRGVVRSRTDNS